MVFNITVKYLSFLKHVPVLPHLFEALLKVETFVTDKPVLDYIDEIENVVLSWEQTSVQPHKFGGTQFNVGLKEIGHIHGNGLLDIPFSKAIKAQVIQEYEGRVKDHHIFKNSGWISFYIRNASDKELAIKLLMRSYDLKGGTN